METKSYILGVDIGSVSISIVKLDLNKDILDTAYLFHHGNIALSLEKAILNIDLTNVDNISVTSSSASYIKNNAQYDQLVSIIRACKHLHTRFGSILNVGGEKFNLSYFDDTMKYSGSKHNTSCAAGTGSFLDQQAIRLDLESSQQLSIEALSNRSSLPDIATRCAVFAKTDLIHAQQEGYSIPQICDGLCKGLAKNIFNTLFAGSNIRYPVIFCGGVSKNLSVVKHLEELLGSKLVIDDYAHLYGALGAALCLADEVDKKDLGSNNIIEYNTITDLFKLKKSKNKSFFPPLSLSLSEYPDFKTFENFIYENVEIDIYIDPSKFSNLDSKQDAVDCYLGIDVGSTSTKSLIMTKDEEKVAGFYTRTASKPVQAILSILKAQDHVLKKYNMDIKILGCGTTGSGRKLAGTIIGADILPDEITAHAKAAVKLNPEVDTIIEIGGQDAKFTTLKNGNVTSSTMNAICAAGTGSFIEEQANKLGCPIMEYSARTESVKSPLSSDRCTVFMERDMNHFLTLGYNTNQVLASALHSVRDNYLSKVASEGEIGNTILFQGATAKNKALVAAFEQKLKKPIYVSKFCHLTGALGICIMLLEQNIKSNSFRGFELHKTKIPIRQETCQICTNHCKITIANTAITSTYDLRLGIVRTQTDDYLNGSIDELRIYNRTLEEDEVLQYYYSNFYKYEEDRWNLYHNHQNLTNGTYTYFVLGKDEFGNEYSTETRTLSVAIDNVIPNSVTNLANQSVGTAWVYWNWTNPESDFSQAIVFIDGVNLANTSNNYYNATGLSAETNYTITIHTKDSVGNINDTDVNDSAVTLANPDLDVPVIQSTTPDNGSSLSAGTINYTIVLVTNENATCRYSNNSNATWGDMIEMNNTNSTNHNQTVTGLSNGNTYNYYFLCEDDESTPNRMNSSYHLRFSVSSPSNNDDNEGGGGGGGGGSSSSEEEGVLEIEICDEDWACTTWGECVDGMQTRICGDWNKCGTENYMPALEQECDEEIVEESVVQEVVDPFIPKEENFKLEKSEKIPFEYSGKTHHISITSIEEDKVTLIIESEPIKITLKIGQSKNIDIDSDEIPDIMAVLNSIVNGKADITIRFIGKGMGSVTGQAIKVLPYKAPNPYYLIPTLLLLIIFIALVSIKKEHLSKKKKIFVTFLHFALMGIIMLIFVSSFFKDLPVGSFIKNTELSFTGTDIEISVMSVILICVALVLVLISALIIYIEREKIQKLRKRIKKKKNLNQKKMKKRTKGKNKKKFLVHFLNLKLRRRK